MQWIIHIGTQKTGSKALQLFLAGRPSGDRIAYPLEGREGIWHEPIYYDLLNNDASKVEASVEAWGRQSRDFGVFSCEGFYDLPIEAIELFRRAVGPAKIAIFLRRQEHFANSFLNQLVKAHRISSKEIREFEDALASSMALLDYGAAISKWSRIFGIENINPILYGKGTSAVEAFCRTLGIPLNADYEPPANPNPALDPFSYVVFRKLKERISNPQELPAVIERAHHRLRHRFFDSLKGEPFDLLGPEKRQNIREIYRNSNEWVRSRWFPGQPSLFDELETSSPSELDWSQGDEVVQELLK